MKGRTDNMDKNDGGIRPFGAAAVSMVALIGLAACASVERDETLYNEPGYIAGFADGCQTANESDKSFSTKRVRDDAAFEDDKAYRSGWRAGLLQCKTDYDDQTSDGGRILGEDQNY